MTEGRFVTSVNIDRLLSYEEGKLGPNDTCSLFAELIKTGMAWRLQGSYGRYAAELIDVGYLDDEGNVLRWPEQECGVDEDG
jgi:hypothetical protein